MAANTVNGIVLDTNAAHDLAGHFAEARGKLADGASADQMGTDLFPSGIVSIPLGQASASLYAAIKTAGPAYAQYISAVRGTLFYNNRFFEQLVIELLTHDATTKQQIEGLIADAAHTAQG